MKCILIILTTLISMALASPVSSSVDNLSQSLYVHLNPILERTFQQLMGLASKLVKQLIENPSSRSNTIQPADWVSHIFDGVDPISPQWNSQISEFFANIPTVYETEERSLLNTQFLKSKLHLAMKILVEKLEIQFNRSVISAINQFQLTQSPDHDRLLVDFQQQVSNIFDSTEEQLNQTIDELIDSIFLYLNSLTDRVFG